jgi:AcrR family transcriptional regulator
MTERTPASTGARARILEGAIRVIAREGVGASMADIAAESGVSKALLHYHYADRAHLLAEVVALLASRLGSRERAAMSATSATSAVNALWRCVETELRLGELRVLLELATLHDRDVRANCEAAAEARRTSASHTVARLFASLGLTPRVPPTLLADASVAFLDGLALDAGRGGGGSRDPRVSFDIFWLAMLSLAE